MMYQCRVLYPAVAEDDSSCSTPVGDMSDDEEDDEVMKVVYTYSVPSSTSIVAILLYIRTMEDGATGSDL